jgi:biotin carboxyl carrier protein
MKLFNEIIAPVTGVVTRIVVDNQERVEENQPLLYIQPAPGNQS